MDLIGNRSVRDLWDERADMYADHPFLIFESVGGVTRSYTYGEFNDLLDRTARALHDEFGIRKGDKVTVHLNNVPEYVQVWFALAKMGAVTVHSNTNHSAREVNYTAATSDSTLAVTQPAYESLVAEACKKSDVNEVALVADDDSAVNQRSLSVLVDKQPADPPDVDLAPTDEAQILFTSGTTGDPKGVVQTHSNLLYPGERQTKHLLMQPSDRNATALPLFHVNGETSAISTLTAGATFLLFEEFKTDRFMRQLKTYRATITALIGTQVRALLAKDAVDGDTDLRVITFALNVSEDKKERFESEVGAPLLNGYGLSEAMSYVTLAPLNRERRWPSIGLPMFDRDIHLLDDEGEPVEQGEMGEVAVKGVRGRNIFMEYYDMPEKTAETFTDDGLLLTGDYGRFDEAGYLYFVDRKKNIIKTRGENVSEKEVEEVLEEHPDVHEVAVVGMSHEIYGEAVRAVVNPATDSPDAADIMEFATGKLAEFKVPEAVDFVEELPRTSIGKVEKSSLRD